MTAIAAAELWRRVAAAADVDAVYGRRDESFDVVPVADAVAPLFALAHERIHGARAAVYRGDGVFELPAVASGPRRAIVVESAEGLVAAVPALRSPGELQLRLSLHPDEPVPDLFPPWAAVADTWVEPDADALRALHAATSIVVLAGPGVNRAVPGLHDLAAVLGVGVLNTWGAKGVFDWRSRHHLATVGLQADDFVLGGLGEADLIVATGLDQAESPEQRWRLGPAIELPVDGLSALAERCRPRGGVPSMPPLRSRLAHVTQRGWMAERGPLPPSRVTRHYGECVGAGALVAADSGLAGFWVARTLGTTRLGAVIVPSTWHPGLAAACVAVARLRRPGRAALAVTDRDPGDDTAAVVDAAAALGVHVPVEVWDPEGEPLDVDARPSSPPAARFRRAFRREQSRDAGHGPAPVVGDGRRGRTHRGVDVMGGEEVVSDFVRVERRDAVALVTLDHPPDRNALSLAMTRALSGAVKEVVSDAQVGAMVVASAGPVFSSGGSVDELFEPKAPLGDMYAGVVAVSECGLPTVAAVNGPALGAGMNLALACDVIVCTPAARFESRFVDVGLHPGGGHLWHLRQRLGRQGAAAMSLFGEVLTGEEAVERKVAWRCVPDAELLAVALDLASRAARADRALATRVRATLDRSAAVHTAADALALELPAQEWAMGRPEFRAALQRLRARLGRSG